MSKTLIQKWFKELKKIWLNKDIVSLQSIIAEGCVYYENPFDEPLLTLKEVKSVWQEVNNQKVIRLDINILIDNGTEGSAMYHFIYFDEQKIKHESKGAYYVKLDVNGKAIQFRQWWVQLK